MRYAVKVAYDGRKFHGSQIQPGLRTVEGDFLEVAERIGIIEDRMTFSRASRTDAGVSALGNIFTFESGFRKEEILPALNSQLRDIWVRGISKAPEDFNPRWAVRRRYRYYLPYAPDFDVEAATVAASLFQGEHDFSSYTRDRGKETIINLEDVRVIPAGISINLRNSGGSEGYGIEDKELARFLQIDITANHFLWNMVRRIIGAVTAVGSGEMDVKSIKSTLIGSPLPAVVRPAPPELLLLMDIEYREPLPMEYDVEMEALFHEDGLFSPVFCSILSL